MQLLITFAGAKARFPSGGGGYGGVLASGRVLDFCEWNCKQVKGK